MLGLIFGATPAQMLTGLVLKYGSDYIQHYLWYWLISTSIQTITDPWYISFSWHTLTYISFDHYDTLIALPTWLISADDEFGGLDFLCKHFFNSPWVNLQKSYGKRIMHFT